MFRRSPAPMMEAAAAWHYCTEKMAEESNRKIGKKLCDFPLVFATIRRIFI
jgi:hypothetical protein